VRAEAEVAAGRTIPHDEVDRVMRQKWPGGSDA
jgi:hypothetical protein